MLKIPQDILDAIKSEAKKTAQEIENKRVKVSRQGNKTIVEYLGEKIEFRDPVSSISNVKKR